KRVGAELWMSAQTHLAETGPHPMELTNPCKAYQAIIDVAIFLEPHGPEICVRLLKDHEDVTPHDTHLELHPDTLRLVTEDEEPSNVMSKMPPNAFTLLSGGAQGAETEFGACAERFGLQETTFSFAGRAAVRQRGLHELSAHELRQ